jgi:ribulose-5-phosphate 4-epimerase/fuculose-1-phosphate aldolase
MHTHTTAGMAVASSAAGLQITNFYAAQLGGRVAYHDFEGITVHADEGARMLQSIGDKPAVILRNHGLLAWGPRLPGTFYTLWILQRACEIQLRRCRAGPGDRDPARDPAQVPGRRQARQHRPRLRAREFRRHDCAWSTAQDRSWRD